MKRLLAWAMIGTFAVVALAIAVATFRKRLA